MAEWFKSKKVFTEEVPLIPLKDIIVFPHMVMPIFVGRDKSMKALEQVLQSENHDVLLVGQRDVEVADPEVADLHKVGCLSTVKEVLKLPDGTAKILVEGEFRARIISFIHFDPFIKAKVSRVQEPEKIDIETEGLMRAVLSQFEEVAELGKMIHPEVIIAARNIQEPGWLGDLIATYSVEKTEDRQVILEIADINGRLNKVAELLAKELEVLKIGKEVQSHLKEQLEKGQREMILREQLKAIQDELGVLDDRSTQLTDLYNQIKSAGMPEEVEDKALKELDRYKNMPEMSAEAPVLRNYLDWLIGFPWSKHTEDVLDIDKSKQILDEDHYGLGKPKERVLQFLAVRKLVDRMKGPILCFVGPPGTGKTSIGRSIARALDRKFIRISLGGVRDEAEIRGHRRTYVGALPGRIVQAIKQVGTNNPVFMMDEIDKVGADFRGDPTAALLEVLDPEQNYSFSDHYMEVPADLSNVMFITTANILDSILPALRDRMEIIEFPGYTEDEKLKIAEMFLVPKQIKENGLSDEIISFDEEALLTIIRRYTREAGVRNLEREIATVCRIVAKDYVAGKIEKVLIENDSIQKYLGPPRFRYGMAEEKDEIGMATALAWTEVGGDILSIEVTLMTGKGNLILTGQLGKVMEESARAALSYARSNAKRLGIDPAFYDITDVHIHVPAGAIPKDGPSAGITMAASLISALTRQPIRKDVGMTGEITLRGKVLEIGGIKEKVLAAHRAGLKTIIIPRDNEKDLIEDVPEQVREGLNFVFVDHMDQVLEMALVDGLPKLFERGVSEMRPEKVSV